MRLYIRGNCKRFLTALVNELTNWISQTRLKSAQLLKVLIVLCEEHITQEVYILLPAFIKALKFAYDDKDIQLFYILLEVYELFGRYILPEIYIYYILPRLRGDEDIIQFGIDNETRIIVIIFLQSLLQGSKYGLIIQHFDELISTLTDSNLISIESISSLSETATTNILSPPTLSSSLVLPSSSSISLLMVTIDTIIIIIESLKHKSNTIIESFYLATGRLSSFQGTMKKVFKFLLLHLSIITQSSTTTTTTSYFHNNNSNDDLAYNNNEQNIRNRSSRNKINIKNNILYNKIIRALDLLSYLENDHTTKLTLSSHHHDHHLYRQYGPSLLIEAMNEYEIDNLWKSNVGIEHLLISHFISNFNLFLTGIYDNNHSMKSSYGGNYINTSSSDSCNNNHIINNNDGYSCDDERRSIKFKNEIISNIILFLCSTIANLNHHLNTDINYDGDEIDVTVENDILLHFSILMQNLLLSLLSFHIHHCSDVSHYDNISDQPHEHIDDHMNQIHDDLQYLLSSHLDRIIQIFIFDLRWNRTYQLQTQKYDILSILLNLGRQKNGDDDYYYYENNNECDGDNNDNSTKHVVNSINDNINKMNKINLFVPINVFSTDMIWLKHAEQLLHSILHDSSLHPNNNIQNRRKCLSLTSFILDRLYQVMMHSCSSSDVIDDNIDNSDSNSNNSDSRNVKVFVMKNFNFWNHKFNYDMILHNLSSTSITIINKILKIITCKITIKKSIIYYLINNGLHDSNENICIKSIYIINKMMNFMISSKEYEFLLLIFNHHNQQLHQHQHNHTKISIITTATTATSSGDNHSNNVLNNQNLENNQRELLNIIYEIKMKFDKEQSLPSSSLSLSSCILKYEDFILTLLQKHIIPINFDNNDNHQQQQLLDQINNTLRLLCILNPNDFENIVRVYYRDVMDKHESNFINNYSGSVCNDDYYNKDYDNKEQNVINNNKIFNNNDVNCVDYSDNGDDYDKTSSSDEARVNHQQGSNLSGFISGLLNHADILKQFHH